ncbi:uncharacterized protein CTRU02_209183 [Colletotrichum truncatum]|uniref:Uncharacterized protein n=1 Tax=Colletotrichum truncatum TaxID=5467 RepID=A0ACC3YYS5_COLTU
MPFGQPARHYVTFRLDVGCNRIVEVQTDRIPSSTLDPIHVSQSK